MGENTHQNCTRQNKNKEDPGRQQPCWGLLFCTNLTQPTGNLDSRTGQEVMELLGRIFRKWGTTFILVSHDEEMYRYTDREIRLKDGKIEQQTLREERML